MQRSRIQPGVRIGRNILDVHQLMGWLQRPDNIGLETYERMVQTDETIAAGLEANRRARNALAYAYQVLQDAAIAGRDRTELAPQVAAFGQAMERYREGSYTESENTSKRVVAEVRRP